MVDLQPSRRIALIFQKMKYFSDPEPFGLEPARRIAVTHCDIPKTEKVCMSGVVKFGEKAQNVNPVGNHPYYFIE